MPAHVDNQQLCCEGVGAAWAQHFNLSAAMLRERGGCDISVADFLLFNGDLLVIGEEFGNWQTLVVALRLPGPGTPRTVGCHRGQAQLRRWTHGAPGSFCDLGCRLLANSQDNELVTHVAERVGFQ